MTEQIFENQPPMEDWRGKGKIKSVYRIQMNNQVYIYDEEGLPLRQYDGKFDFMRDKVLAEAPSDAEFYISRWGTGNFEKVTRKQWAEEE